MNQIEFYQAKLNFETDPWDLHEILSAAGDVVVIDARSPQAYADEHIPGAINIPHRDMSGETTSELDKGKLHVTYCDGIGCNASTKGALKMAMLGFTVKELIGGLEWWKRDGFETAGRSSENGKPVQCGC